MPETPPHARSPRRRRVLRALAGFTLAAVALLSWLWLDVLAGPDEPLDDPAKPLPLYRADSKDEGPLLAGAAKVDITPEKPGYLAGFGQGRKSTGVHDRLHARALVLERGGLRIALVVCDLIGLGLADVEKAKALVKSCLPPHVIVASTHDHAGPDTLGFWGEAFVVSGRDEAYLETLRARIAEAVDAASARLEPARIALASGPVPDGVARNARRADLIDREVSVLAVDAVDDGAPIATLVNFGMHPEALGSKNTLITADFPHYLCARVEERRGGGVCVFANGALGGMVTVDLRPDEKGTFAAAERAGTAVADAALAALAGARPLEAAPRLALRRSPLRIASTNRFINLFAMLGRFGRPLDGGVLTTPIVAVAIGPADLVTVPGEILPGPGLELKSRLAGRPRFLVSLAEEELGYLIAAKDFDDDLYDYERGWCLGRDAADRIGARAAALAATLRE